MPLHTFQDETNRNSSIVTTTNDRVSSLGAFDSLFTKVQRKKRFEDQGKLDSTSFSVGDKAVRQWDLATLHRLSMACSTTATFGTVGPII